MSFYTPATDSRYRLSVYKGVKNSPVTSEMQRFHNPVHRGSGYHTIPLSSPVLLQKGERFSVVVKLTTPGYKYPVAVEYPLSGFSSGARATNGQSYVSSSGTTWTDLNSVYPNTNVCLKAFTIQGSVYPALTPAPDIPLAEPDITAPSVLSPLRASSGSFVPGSSIQVTWSANDNIDVTGVDISYSKDQGKTWIPAASNLAKEGTYNDSHRCIQNIHDPGDSEGQRRK